MDDRRPVQIADAEYQRRFSSSDRTSPATTGELILEPSPPFRSGRVLLDDGRSVGLSEPFDAVDAPAGGSVSGPPASARRTLPLPGFLRSSWGGAGAWLGALTVVGLAAMMFGPRLADMAGAPRPVDSEQSQEGAALGLGIGGGTSALSDDGRASRARTTGELTAGSAPGRSSGPTDGPDLDLRSRSGDEPVAGRGPAGGSVPAPSAGGATTPTASADPTASTDPIAAGAGGATPSGEPSATAPQVEVGRDGEGTDGEGTDGEGTDGEGTDDRPGSSPPGSTSIPEPGTLPPPLSVPVPVTRPPSIPPSTTPSTGPAVTVPNPSVPAAPPTTRKPVPADTRPSQGGENPGRGRGANPKAASNSAHGSKSSNGSNGRAVGRPR